MNSAETGQAIGADSPSASSVAVTDPATAVSSRNIEITIGAQNRIVIAHIAHARLNSASASRGPASRPENTPLSPAATAGTISSSSGIGTIAYGCSTSTNSPASGPTTAAAAYVATTRPPGALAGRPRSTTNPSSMKYAIPKLNTLATKMPLGDANELTANTGTNAAATNATVATTRSAQAFPNRCTAVANRSSSGARGRGPVLGASLTRPPRRRRQSAAR